ncbi:MAG TPA: cache domain-containing protein, partial [Ramlibacter sp.]
MIWRKGERVADGIVGNRVRTPARHASALPTLRQLLLLLAFACVLPMAGLTFALVGYQYQRERALVQAEAVGTARALMAAVDDRLRGTERALLALAQSPAMATGDLATIHQAALVLQHAEEASNVLLLDASGRQAMNTAAPVGAPLPTEAWPQMLAAIRTRKPSVVDLYRSPLTGRFRVGVAIPVQAASGPMLGLNANIDPASLREVLTRQKLPPSWIAAVLDRSGAIIARTHEHERHVGERARAALVARIGEVPEDAVESVTVDGVPVVTAFSRSPHYGWSVVIGIPRSELSAPLVRTSGILLGGIAGVLLLILGLAWWMASRLGRSVEALGSAVRAMGHHAALDLPEPVFQEARQLGLAFAHAHAALDDAHEALATSEARMRAILETATEAIVTADDNGRIVLFTPAAERMFRIDAEDALGSPVESLVPQHVRSAHVAMRQQAPEGLTRQ